MHWFRSNGSPQDFVAKEAARQKALNQLKEEATITGRVVELCLSLEEKVLDLLNEQRWPTFQTNIDSHPKLSIHRLSHPSDPLKITGRLERLVEANNSDITEFNINREKSNDARHLFISRRSIGPEQDRRENGHFVIWPIKQKVELFAPGCSGDLPLRLASEVGKSALKNLVDACQSIDSIVNPAA